MKRKEPEKKWSIDTLLQHGGYDPEEHGGHLNPPLYLDIAPVQPSIKKAAQSFADAEAGFTYARRGHPNLSILEKRLALLEGSEDAFVFASGMAATNCLLLELVKPGQNIVAPLAMYGGTVGFLMKDFKDAGREARFVINPLDISEWRSNISGKTAAVWVEMPSNPVVGLVDLERIAELARGWGAPLVVDSTFVPLLFRPLDWGASLVMRSGSKYENPGGTSLLGFVMGPKGFINPIRNGRYERYGAPASPLDAWLAEIGMRTLALRMRRQSDSARLIALWLGTNPRVSKVHYPSLEGSPYKCFADKYLPDGCGAVLAFELKGGKKACERFMTRIKLFKHVVNLGDTRSLATYPWGTTHSKMSPRDRKRAGITLSMIRLSIGLEKVQELYEDLKRALR